MPSELYNRITEWNEANNQNDSLRLHHQVWDGTPWVCDAYVGRDFGGHEMTAMIGPGQLATGKIWCPVCAHEDANGHLNRSPIA